MKQLKQVTAFMLLMGQPVLATPTVPPMDRLKLRLHLSNEELREFKEAVEAGNRTEIFDALLDRLYVLLGDFNECGMGHLLEAGFDLVQASNMSKCCLTEEQATDSVKLLTEQLPEGSPEQYYHKQVGEYWIVYNSADKVQKPIGYFKPDLRVLLTPQVQG